MVVGRAADARARLACAGAVARTRLNIVYMVVKEVGLSMGGFGGMDGGRLRGDVGVIF